MGLIDILQEWDTSKKGERCLKVLQRLGKDRDGISCIEPSRYRLRFLESLQSLLVSSDELQGTANEASRVLITQPVLAKPSQARAAARGAERDPASIWSAGAGAGAGAGTGVDAEDPAAQRVSGRVTFDATTYVDCRRFSYQECHMLSVVPSRGPYNSYQDSHMFPIIVRRYGGDEKHQRDSLL